MESDIALGSSFGVSISMKVPGSTQKLERARRRPMTVVAVHGGSYPESRFFERSAFGSPGRDHDPCVAERERRLLACPSRTGGGESENCESGCSHF